MARALSERTLILSASELLAQRQEAIQRLHGLSATSEMQFKAIFLPLLRAFAESVQTVPKREQGQTTILDGRLQRAERALHRRRGVILPSGADPEQVAREEDWWTYAAVSYTHLDVYKRQAPRPS